MKIVTATNNSPVRLRKEPNGEILASIAQGTKVEVLSDDGTWSKIQVGNQAGYMMSKFLKEDVQLGELKAKLKEVLQLIDKLEAQA